MTENTTRKLKIAMIGAKGVPAIFGGVERSVDELGGRLASYGHAVSIYSRAWYSTTTKPTYKGMKIIKTPTIHTKHLDAIVHTFTSTIHALFRGYDIIHYHGVGPSLLAWIPRVFTPQVKVVISFQSIDREHAKWNWFARLVLRIGEWAASHFGHVVLASSFMIGQYIKDTYGVRSEYLPNGATIPEAVNVEFDAEIVRDFSLQPKQYIAVVTRLVAHKGVHEIIAAYLRAKKSHPEVMTNKQLAIVGDGAFTDEYLQSLKAIAAHDDSIVFTGFQSGATLHALMRQAQFAVHASYAEGLPMSVLEIMAQGVPVLVSDIAPHLEAVKDERFIFPVGNVDALEHAMIRLALDPDFVEKQGEHVQAFIAQRYNWDTIAQKLSGIYEELQVVEPYGAGSTSVV